VPDCPHRSWDNFNAGIPKNGNGDETPLRYLPGGASYSTLCLNDPSTSTPPYLTLATCALSVSTNPAPGTWWGSTGSNAMTSSGTAGALKSALAGKQGQG
jgi:hypothetical protein